MYSLKCATILYNSVSWSAHISANRRVTKLFKKVTLTNVEYRNTSVYPVNLSPLHTQKYARTKYYTMMTAFWLNIHIASRQSVEFPFAGLQCSIYPRSLKMFRIYRCRATGTFPEMFECETSTKFTKFYNRFPSNEVCYETGKYFM